MKFTKEDLARIKLNSHLIEPPASEVIGLLCDEIERLQAENEKLREALKKIKDWCCVDDDGTETYIRKLCEQALSEVTK